MPKERITMAIIVSIRVNPRSRLFERIWFIRISSFIPRRAGPRVGAHAAGATNNGYRASRVGLIGNSDEDRAVQRVIDRIGEGARGTKLHDRRASADHRAVTANIDRRAIAEEHRGVGNTTL